MNQYHVGWISVKGYTKTAIWNQVIPDMGDILMSWFAEGFIMAELITDNYNNILCLILSESTTSTNKQ
jgi:hypothetical protein